MSDTSLPELLLRMAVSLGVVVGLLFVAGRVLSGRWTVRGLPRTSAAGSGNRPAARTRRNNKQPAVELLGRQQLGRAVSVHVIRAHGRTLVVGVGADTVTLLASGDEPIVDPVEAGASVPADVDLVRAAAPTSWRPVVDALRERTVRRT